MTVFHEKEAPDEQFTHAPDCKIVRSDPRVQIPSRVRRDRVTPREIDLAPR